MFRKGRTIVSYLHSPVRKLLAAAAYAIQLMLNTVWNGLDLSLPEIWRRIHHFLQDMPSSVELLEFGRILQQCAQTDDHFCLTIASS